MISICFSKSTSWFRPFSAAIIWWDKLRYGADVPMSHCSGKFKAVAWDRDLFYQASGKATNFMGGVHFLDHNEIMEEYVLDVPDEVAIKIGRICLDREGKKYAIMQTVGLFYINMVYLSTGVTLKNPLADGDAEVNCIEEWAKILSEEGYAPPLDMDNTSVWPFRNWIATLEIARKV